MVRVQKRLLRKGLDWESYFAGNNFPAGDPHGQYDLPNHGVDVGQALKSGAVW